MTSASKESSEKPKEKEKDADVITYEDIREHLKLVEKGVSHKESRYINRALRGIAAVRKRLNDAVLRRLLITTFPPGSTTKSILMPFLEEPMDAEDAHIRPKSTRAPPPPPEVECFVHVLVVVLLLDRNNLQQAQSCIDQLMEKLFKLNSRTLDHISAKCYFYYARVAELRGNLADIRSTLHARLRTATLRHDEAGQAILLNLLLRNYLHYNLYDQANKLIAKATFPDSAG